MTGAFSQTIDWLAFTVPHATVDEVIQIVGGDWITIEHGFRGYPICSMTHNGRQGVGKLGTGAHRNPTEVHVDLSAGIVSTWEEHKLRQVLGWIFDKQGHVTRFSAQSTSPPGAEKTL